MTPKEKAFELYKMYNNILIEEIIDRRPTYLVMTHKMAKKSALIAVDEVLSLCWGGNQIGIKHWQDIRNEIEKL